MDEVHKSISGNNNIIDELLANVVYNNQDLNSMCTGLDYNTVL